MFIKLIFLLLLAEFTSSDQCDEFPELPDHKCCNMDHNSMFTLVFKCGLKHVQLYKLLKHITNSTRLCIIVEECFIKGNKLLTENNEISTEFLKKTVEELIESNLFVNSYYKSIDYCVENVPKDKPSNENCSHFGVALIKCISYINYFKYCPDKYWRNSNKCLQWREYYQTCSNTPEDDY